MQEDQKGCKKNNIRAEEEQIIAARTKQHEDEEEDTGKRPAGRGNKGTKDEANQCQVVYYKIPVKRQYVCQQPDRSSLIHHSLFL